MKKFKTTLLLVLAIILIAPLLIITNSTIVSSMVNRSETILFTFESNESDSWSQTKQSDYPEIVKIGNRGNKPVELWTPEPFAEKGQLDIKWTKDIPYAFRQTNTFFNNTPEGWLYITTDIKPGEYDVVLSDSYTNKLINPENGEFEILEPKYSMFSYLSTDPHICCSPPAHLDAKDEYPVNIRCYNIKNRELLWNIRDTRSGTHDCAPYLPVSYVGDYFYYAIDGVTAFDSRTGLINWSNSYSDENKPLFKLIC